MTGLQTSPRHIARMGSGIALLEGKLFLTAEHGEGLHIALDSITCTLFHTGHESPESPRIDFFLIRGGGGGGGGGGGIVRFH